MTHKKVKLFHKVGYKQKMITHLSVHPTGTNFTICQQWLGTKVSPSLRR